MRKKPGMKRRKNPKRRMKTNLLFRQTLLPFQLLQVLQPFRFQELVDTTEMLAHPLMAEFVRSEEHTSELQSQR